MFGLRLRGLPRLQQGGLLLNLLLKNGDIFLECPLSRICPPRLALKLGYPMLHLLPLNLPGIALALVAMPFGLEKAHNT